MTNKRTPRNHDGCSLYDSDTLREILETPIGRAKEPKTVADNWIQAIEDGAYALPDKDTFQRMISEMDHYNFYRVLSDYNWTTGIELGCGWALLSLAFSDNRKILAIDISGQLIRGLNKMDLGPVFIMWNIFKVRNMASKFDLLFSDGTYQHYDEEDRISFLDNAKSIMKEDGILAISVPNLCNPFLHGASNEQMPKMYPFTVATLTDELETSGLTVIETGYSFVNPGFEQWVKYRWMIPVIKFVNRIFPFIPFKNVFAAHLFVIAVYCTHGEANKTQEV